MAKVLQQYRGFSATEMHAKMSNTCDHAVSGTTVECTNVTTAKITNIISGSSNSVSVLCKHANVNKWSAFSPILMSISSAGMNGTIVWTAPANNYMMGSFAGYNHSAITPAYYSTTHADTVSVASDAEAVNVEVQFDIGELTLTNLNSAMGITLAVFNGATYITNATRALSTLKEQCRASNSLAFTVTVTGPSGSSSWDNQQYINYTFNLYLISGTTYSYNTNEIAKLFHVQLPPFTKKILKQFPTVAYASMQSGYTCSYLTYSYATGLISCIVAANSGSGHGIISATTFNDANEQTAYTELYHGTVDTSGVTLSNVNIGTNPAYNKYVRLSFSTH